MSTWEGENNYWGGVRFLYLQEKGWGCVGSPRERSKNLYQVISEQDPFTREYTRLG